MKTFYEVLKAEGLLDDLSPAEAESFARVSAELERQDELMHEINARIVELNETIASMGGKVRHAS